MCVLICAQFKMAGRASLFTHTQHATQVSEEKEKCMRKWWPGVQSAGPRSLQTSSQQRASNPLLHQSALAAKPRVCCWFDVRLMQSSSKAEWVRHFLLMGLVPNSFIHKCTTAPNKSPCAIVCTQSLKRLTLDKYVKQVDFSPWYFGNILHRHRYLHKMFPFRINLSNLNI